MMIYGVFSANEWVYPDTDPAAGHRGITVNAAGNSYANAQILLKGVTPDISASWHSDNLPAPEVNRLISVYVDQNTGTKGHTVPQGTFLPHNIRKAPFIVYEAMEPIPAETVGIHAEEGVLALYLRWNTKDIPAGSYTGTFIIGEARINVAVKVYPVRIPEKTTLRMTNWFHVGNMGKYHGAEEWSEEHWEMIKVYGERMREAHQTDFMTPVELVQYRKTETGYVFNVSRMERFIRLYLSLRFTNIESFTPIIRKDWGDNEFFVKIFEEPVRATSPEGEEFIKAYFKAIYAILEKNGWKEITEQHVADEPHSGCRAEYEHFGHELREWMPDLLFIDAVESPEIDIPDIMVFKANDYDENTAAYEARRANGRALWYYTCCIPGGYYLNRMFDMELLRTRYTHWANKLYDWPGFLRCGLNNYHRSVGPYYLKNIPGIGFGIGDQHILYPKDKQVLKGVRFEMMRAGVEDYELLTMVDKKDHAAYERVMKACVRSSTDYTTDVAAFEAAYDELLELAGK